MPKRKSDETLQKIQHKMKKLNKRLKKYHRRKKYSSSESDESSSESSSSSNSSSSYASKDQENQVEVQDDIIQVAQNPVDILGTDPLALVAVGPEVHAEIASRWTTFCRIGVDKNERKSLIEKYPRPSNVDGLSPPQLNSEISACLTEALIKQDNFLLRIQEQIATAVAAIATPMNLYFSNPSDETNAQLQVLANASKLLTDVIHSLSTHRKYGLSNSIDTSIRKVVMERPIDDYLFGDELLTHIKSAQELKKVSNDIKTKNFSVPSTSSGSRPQFKNSLPRSSGKYTSGDFLARRSKYNHRKKTEGNNRRDQRQKRIWHKRADSRRQ